MLLCGSLVRLIHTRHRRRQLPAFVFCYQGCCDSVWRTSFIGNSSGAVRERFTKRQPALSASRHRPDKTCGYTILTISADDQLPARLERQSGVRRLLRTTSASTLIILLDDQHVLKSDYPGYCLPIHTRLKQRSNIPAQPYRPTLAARPGQSATRGH